MNYPSKHSQHGPFAWILGSLPVLAASVLTALYFQLCIHIQCYTHIHDTKKSEKWTIVKKPDVMLEVWGCRDGHRPTALGDKRKALNGFPFLLLALFSWHFLQKSRPLLIQLSRLVDGQYDQFFMLKVVGAQTVSYLLQKHMIIPSLYSVFCSWDHTGLIAYTQ